MAESLGAEQTLKYRQTFGWTLRFPVGRAARTWQIAASNRVTVGRRQAFPH
jgi:hypothetical protein